MTVAAPEVGIVEFGPPTRNWWGRPVVASLVVLAVYAVLAASFDGRGHLGGDTASKIAVLDAVDSGDRPQFDIGYWAAAEDSEARYHPLYYTTVVDGRYQQLTTLPMTWLARPLYDIGGSRLVLVLPMLGALLTAFGVRALAVRLGTLDPWPAFWLAALASPVAVYALDFWEHTLGLAGIVWGVVVLVDIVDHRRRAGIGGMWSGLAFGAAATMRTEAVAYAAVAVATFAAVAVIERRDWSRSARMGAGAVAGIAGVLVLNEWFERVVLGASLRTARTVDAVGGVGGRFSDRVEGAWVSTIGLNYANVVLDRVLGLVLLVGLVAATVGAARGHAGTARIGVAAAAAAFAVRLASGLSFIPGLVPVFPIVVVGAVVGATRRSKGSTGSTGSTRSTRSTRAVAIVALVTIPLVWATQYAGMPGAQWGARYLFGSGALLLAVAVSHRDRFVRAARVALVVISIAVTASGVLYLRARTHEIGRTIDSVEAIDDDVVVIARVAFFWRELGAVHDAEQLHLTVVDADGLAAAARIAAGRRADEIAIIQEVAERRPHLAGYRVVGTSTLPWVGRDLVVVRYESD